MMLRLISIIIVLLVTPSTIEGQAPSDFGLRLEFGCAAPDIVDTFKGTYERGMRKGRRTAKIRISSDLREHLHTLVNEAQFFETAEPVHGLSLCEPSTSYRLFVTSSGRTHVVSWDDCHLEMPTTEDGRRMRALAEGLLRPFRAMSVVKRLPASDLICL